MATRRQRTTAAVGRLLALRRGQPVWGRQRPAAISFCMAPAVVLLLIPSFRIDPKVSPVVLTGAAWL